ncbi:MAG: hypothetical protein M3R36_03395 [Bacteroidota bacterium]|nr:hypothetical protein [Bacteroidota bacterium]
MKILKYILSILFITSVGYAQNVKITDFNIPVSTAKQMLIGGSYNWAQTGDSVTTNQFNVNGAFNTFYTSLPFSWDLGLNASLSGKYQDSTRAAYNLAANINKYFTQRTSAFYFAGLTSSYLRQSEFGRENRPEINVLGGLGYGRLVDATAMAKAIRIDEDLKRFAVTTAYMPKTTMQEIARIIDRESQYRTLYKSIYEYKIIGDILKLIEASGVAGEFVTSSLSYFRIREVLFGINQFINPRYYGGDIRTGVGYTVLTRNDSLKNPAPTLNLQGRYSYPLDLHQQINFTAGANSPFDSSFATLIQGTGNVNYSYNLTNRISFIAGYTINLIQQIDNVIDTTTNSTFGIVRDFSTPNHIFTTGFNFYLENYITLGITAGLNKRHDEEGDKFTNVTAIFTVF